MENCYECWNQYNKLSQCKECDKDICYKCKILDRCKTCYLELENNDKPKLKVLVSTNNSRNRIIST